MSSGRSKKPTFGLLILGAAVAVAGVMVVRALTRAVSSPSNEEIDDNAPLWLSMYRNEGQYPPFLDTVNSAITVEPLPDRQSGGQLVVIGVDQKEFDSLLQNPGAMFALARSDSSDIWHPAVAEQQLFYGAASDAHGEVYAFGLPLDVSEFRLLAGVMHDEVFTPFKTTRLLALTNKDGLLYDYPNVPIVRFA